MVQAVDGGSEDELTGVNACGTCDCDLTVVRERIVSISSSVFNEFSTGIIKSVNRRGTVADSFYASYVVKLVLTEMASSSSEQLLDVICDGTSRNISHLGSTRSLISINNRDRAAFSLANIKDESSSLTGCSKGHGTLRS